ncbi:MAG: type II secretion system protein GspN [Desulfocapsa sp.]|nr:type II secretion system protein GspN [Desulfocapsa sp.]
MKHTISRLFNKSKIILVALILFIFGLVAGIFFSFPEMKVKQKIISAIETQGHVIVDQGEITMGFLTIKGSDFLIRPENPLWPTISIDSFSITPQWLTLLSKNPGVRLDMQLFGGKLWADIFRDGTLIAAASQLNLGLLLPKEQAIKVSGQLEKMTLASVVPLGKTSESLVTLTLKSVNVTGNSDLPLSLNLGDVAINGTGRGRSFKIMTLRADKGDLQINGNGSLLLGRDLASTQVNMKIEMRPEAQIDPMLVDLLTLGSRQTPNGGYELKLSGTLSKLLFRGP